MRRRPPRCMNGAHARVRRGEHPRCVLGRLPEGGADPCEWLFGVGAARRLSDRVVQPANDALDRVLVREVVAEHDELPLADPRDRVVGPHRFLEPAGERPHSRVGRCRARGHDLEPHHEHPPVEPPGPGEADREAVAQQEIAGQAGLGIERVLVLPFELLPASTTRCIDTSHAYDRRRSPALHGYRTVHVDPVCLVHVHYHNSGRDPSCPVKSATRARSPTRQLATTHEQSRHRLSSVSPRPTWAHAREEHGNAGRAQRGTSAEPAVRRFGDAEQNPAYRMSAPGRSGERHFPTRAALAH